MDQACSRPIDLSCAAMKSRVSSRDLGGHSQVSRVKLKEKMRAPSLLRVPGSLTQACLPGLLRGDDVALKLGFLLF